MGSQQHKNGAWRSERWRDLIIPSLKPILSGLGGNIKHDSSAVSTLTIICFSGMSALPVS